MRNSAYDKLLANILEQFKDTKKPRLMAEVVTVKKEDKNAGR